MEARAGNGPRRASRSVPCPPPDFGQDSATQTTSLHRRNPLWQRLLVLGILALGAALSAVLVFAVALGVLMQRPWFQEWFFSQVAARSWTAGDQPPPEPRVPYESRGPEPDATVAISADQLFVPTLVWSATLSFSSSNWQAVQPQSVPRVRGWIRPDGTPMLNNTNAPRPGLTGVFGVAQPWSLADFEFGGRAFTNVAVRFKGNGTFLFSQNSYSRPYKLDLSKGHPGRLFAGQSEINLHNLSADRSFVADTLGYEFFRDAGVPAPRTTFTRLFLSIDERWQSRFLGLYAVIEDPGPAWLDAALGQSGGTLFKPVTLELFSDLGDDWAPYESTYNPKSKVPENHRRRLVELARLVSHADEATFARRIFEFVDLEALCRFLACETLLSNYDGIFTNGQNFLLWIDPRNGRFAFGPWDLDHSWGEFELLGTREQRVRASVFHPWVGPHRFFERVFALPEFDARYRAELRRLLDSVFVPDRLERRIDEVAQAIRPAVACLPEERSRGFEHAVGPDASLVASTDGTKARESGHQLKPYIVRRAAEVRAQLEGKSEGLRVTRNARGD